MTTSLCILNGPRIGHRLFLRPMQRIAIGRAELSDVAIPHDLTLSQVHFSLTVLDQGEGRVEDLGSRNGTFVNGVPMLFGRVTHGDVITAGMTVFRVSCDH